MDKYCLDCKCTVSKQSKRCRSCANKNRWNNKNDPRREKIIKRNKSHRNIFLYEDKLWLYDNYTIKKKSIQEIANETNSSKRTIARWLNIHNIKTRSISKAKQISNKKKPKKVNIDYICNICGNKKSYGSNSCSKCYDRNGANNPNYKGILDITTTIRTWSKKYWRPKVLERDNFICNDCGETNRNLLEAHHINHLSKIIKNKVKLYNNTQINKNQLCKKIISDKEIQNIENGITLCKSCHIKKHKN